MNDNVNYAESCVKRKKDAELKRKKFLLAMAYIFIPIIVVIATFAVPILRPFILLPLALTPLALSVIIPLTWCYTEVEYESIFSTGMLTVSYIYNRRRRKKMVELKVEDAEIVAPYTDDLKKQLAGDTSIVTKYNAISDPAAEGVYAVVFTNDKSEKSLLLFQPTDKMLGLIRFFNRGAIIVKVNR